MKNETTTIQKQLRKVMLTADPGTHTIRCKQTTFTLHVPELPHWREERARKIADSTPLRHTPRPLMSETAKAIQLYGSESEAARRIREQLDTQGPDLDPTVAKRARKMADTMEAGHLVIKSTDTHKVWDSKAAARVKRTFEKLETRDAEIAAVLGIGKPFRSELYTLTPDHLDTLRSKGYNLHII